MLWALFAIGLVIALALWWRDRRKLIRALDGSAKQLASAPSGDAARWEAIVASLPDAVVLVAPDGQVTACNAAAAAIFRALPSAPRHFEDLPITARAMSIVREALQGQSLPDGPLDLEQALSLIVDGKQARLLPRVRSTRPGALIVVSDVTEFAMLDQMRVDLVSVASHEFRTPLTTMHMTLLMLQEGAAELSGRQQDLIATALLGVEQLGVTMDEFLDLTRIEAGQLRLNWDRVHIPALVQQTLRTLRPQTDEAGIRVEQQWEQQAPEVIWADPARLRVVLANLLGNAIKYTPRGGRIRVGGSSVQSAGSPPRAALQLAVTDTGEGIPAEFRDRIFDRFFRVENARAEGETRRTGSGIGLYLSREIVEAHGGSIRCEPGDAGVGTTIAVVLPAAPRSVAAEAAP